MPLSPQLVDTYRRYKKETDGIVSWLATTATKVGHVEHLFLTNGGGRLKGKARLDAKQRHPQQQTIQVPLRSPKQLAGVIGSTNLSVSKSILALLRDVIRARKECDAFYYAQEREYTKAAAETLKSSNDGHIHFIQTLEDVHAILQTGLPKEVATATNFSEANNDRGETVSNMFEYLDLQEATYSDYVSLAKVPTANKIKSTMHKLEPSPKHTSAETLFATFCFLKDMTDVRLFVHKASKEYKSIGSP
jgi:hypothetical protein